MKRQDLTPVNHERHHEKQPSLLSSSSLSLLLGNSLESTWRNSGVSREYFAEQREVHSKIMKNAWIGLQRGGGQNFEEK